MTGDIKTGAHRYLVLDSLRGVCAMLVALGHLKNMGFFGRWLSLPSSFLFVDFFFVLSGFVIAASYGMKLAQGFPVGRFMALRLGRVYPLHLLVLIVMLFSELFLGALASGLLGRGLFDESHSASAFVTSLFLVQIFFGQNLAYWNAVSWSIAAEVWAYLIFAWVFRFAGKWIVPVALAIALPMPFLVYRVNYGSMDAFHDGALFRCLCGFALGVVAFRMLPVWESASARIGFAAGTIVEILLVFAAVYLARGGRMDVLAFVAPFLFFLAVSWFARERGAVSALLKRQPFVLLGTLSYSIYMTHHFLSLRAINVLQLAGKLSHGRFSFVTPDGQIGPNPLVSDVLILLILAGVLVVAWFTYRFVEHPGRVWSRKLVLGERARPTEILRERDAPTF
jgi:peptidoglycan/LPS O-acetylase OafA/YrhL